MPRCAHNVEAIVRSTGYIVARIFQAPYDADGVVLFFLSRLLRLFLLASALSYAGILESGRDVLNAIKL